MSKLVSATVCTCVLFAIGSIRAEPEPFTVDCQLPFESIKKHHLIDDALAPLQPLVASVKPETIKEVTPMVRWLMQTVVVFVLLHFFIHVPLAPTVLGVCLVIVALLLPNSVLDEASKGRIKLPGGIDVSFQGGLRLVAIIAGTVLILVGAYQGGTGCRKDYRSVYHQ